jgi:hypothetical protein
MALKLAVCSPPAELDAEEAEAYVPDLPEAQAWLLHTFISPEKI